MMLQTPPPTRPMPNASCRSPSNTPLQAVQTPGARHRRGPSGSARVPLHGDVFRQICGFQRVGLGGDLGGTSRRRRHLPLPDQGSRSGPAQVPAACMSVCRVCICVYIKLPLIAYSGPEFYATRIGVYMCVCVCVRGIGPSRVDLS